MNQCVRVCFAVVLAGGAVSSSRAADWPQYRGPRGDGISPETAPAGWPEGSPRRLWKVETPGGFSSFSTGGGKVFTVIARAAEGTRDETCVALEAATGKELWAARTGSAKYQGGGDSGAEGNRGGDGPRSTPAFSEGRVYVYSSDMELHCFDAGTGRRLWKKSVLSEFQGQNIGWKSALSPVIDGGLLFLAGGGPGQSLLALDKATGAAAWKTGAEKMTHATPVVADVGGVRQVIYLVQSGLVAVEAATGKELWRFPFPHRTCTGCSPVVAGETVFCTAGYEIGGAACRITRSGDGFTATELWRIKGNVPLGDLWSTPVQKDGHLYGMISFKKFGFGPLKCVDLKSGAVRWEKAGFGAGNVILAGNRLIALTDDGQVVLVEANPGAYQELARFKAVSGKCWSTPALSHGRLYVRSTKEGACFELTPQ
jgi:outer membrane protein assembly factor BamB